MTERPTTRLRSLLKTRNIVMVPGVADALNARLVAQEGCEALYMTGAGTTAVRLGMPKLQELKGHYGAPEEIRVKY